MQSRTQNPVPLGRGTKGSGIIHCLPHNSWRSGASAHVQNFFNMEDMELMNKFHDSINNALLRRGKAEISLNEAQFEALKAIVMERKAR